MKVIVVDINGTPHQIDDSENPAFHVLARKSGERYLVLASNENDLFNPLDIKVKINQHDNQRGCPFWNLVTCSRECYEHYTSFLRSRNRTPFLIAQRRVWNDFR